MKEKREAKPNPRKGKKREMKEAWIGSTEVREAYYYWGGGGVIYLFIYLLEVGGDEVDEYCAD